MNNAGFVLGVERVGDISDADLEAMFAVNVFGLISMTQLLIKGQSSSADLSAHRRDNRTSTDFKARKTGHIINIGSIAGAFPLHYAFTPPRDLILSIQGVSRTPAVPSTARPSMPFARSPALSCAKSSTRPSA